MRCVEQGHNSVAADINSKSARQTIQSDLLPQTVMSKRGFLGLEAVQMRTVFWFILGFTEAASQRGSTCSGLDICSPDL